jgi:hypothetical protein
MRRAQTDIPPRYVVLQKPHAAQPDLTWRQVAAGVAAAAGGAAWVSAVGSGVMALRLRQAGLPVEPVVALMSPEHRFAVGAGLLIAPLLAGFVGFLVDCAWGTGREHGRRLTLAGLTTVAGAAAVYVLLRPPPVTFLCECFAVVVVVTGALHLLHKARVDRFHERVAVFLLALVAAGSAAIIVESLSSPSFDEIAIRVLKPSGSLLTGSYITSTEHSVVLAPRRDVVMAVPRDQIARITVRSATSRWWAPGPYGCPSGHCAEGRDPATVGR